jgi:hypothetical protein
MTPVRTFPREPAPIHVSDEVLDDLRTRLALTRPPLDEGNEDWSYGVPASYLRELVAYWRDGYDWRKADRVAQREAPPSVPCHPPATFMERWRGRLGRG